MRKCGKCGKPNHNSRTCMFKFRKENVIAAATAEDKLGTLPEEQEVDDKTPKRGLWIIQSEKQKVYGKILQIKRTGNVLWQSSMGTHVESTPDTLREEDCSFVELEAPMLNWNILHSK